MESFEDSENEELSKKKPENGSSVENETENISGKEVHKNDESDEVHDEDVNSGSREEDFFSFIGKYGLQKNPFVFTIDPSLMVGYEKEREELMDRILQGHRVIMVSGPTGSGKTTLLQWSAIQLQRKGIKSIFFPKPPADEKEMVMFFRKALKKPWFLFFLSPRFHSMPDLIDYMDGKRYVVFMDEAHEASQNILEWLRVMTDQLPNTTFVISGLPRLDEFLRERLETFHQRISARINLSSLTVEEVGKLIEKRMKSAGAKDMGPFKNLVGEIYAHSGGIPREVLRICDSILNNAWKTRVFSVSQPRRAEIVERRYFSISMSSRQREIVNILMKSDMTPPEIVSHLNLSDYKSRQHAVRSVNNILQQLMAMGYVERIRKGKSYIYSLSPKIRNMLVAK